jgi:hypothetical protein
MAGDDVQVPLFFTSVPDANECFRFTLLQLYPGVEAPGTSCSGGREGERLLPLPGLELRLRYLGSCESRRQQQRGNGCEREYK